MSNLFLSKNSCCWYRSPAHLLLLYYDQDYNFREQNGPDCIRDKQLRLCSAETTFILAQFATAV